MIEITVNNVWSRISGLKDIEVADALDKITSFYVEGYRYTKKYKDGWFDKDGAHHHWDGKRHLLTPKMVFPTGLLSSVIDFFILYKLPYQIIDKRQQYQDFASIPIHKYTPRYYQAEALEAAIKHERGIIRMGTGSGKTLLAAMIAAHYNLPTMFYVVGKDLLYQFHKEMTSALNCEIGLIGDGHCEIKKFNVCSVWTAITSFGLKQKVSLDDEDWSPEIVNIGKKEKQLIKSAVEETEVAIYDEAHFLATDTIQSIYKAGKKCRFLFGLSGTDWRDDGADLLLESVCGQRIYNMPSSKLIEDNFLVPANIVVYDVPGAEYEPLAKYHSIYSQYITKNEVRNDLIASCARTLIKKGRKTLILVRYINHGNILAKKLADVPLFFVNGEIDGETRQEVKKALEGGEYKCLIASSVFDIGVDIPCLDALILAGGGKSTVRALQRIGRVIRPSENKKDALVVDFFDNAKYLNKHSSVRLAVYETENRFRIKFPKGFDYEKIKRPRNIKKKISG